MKVEEWNGHRIRFIDLNGDWWAIGTDVTDALGYTNGRDAVARHISNEDKNTVVFHDGNRGNPRKVVVNEYGIYDLVLSSHLEEARPFRRWVHSVIKELREAVGLESYQAFKMADVEHQKEAMRQLNEGLGNAQPVDFIKANTIANKAISNQYGRPKMIPKKEMSPAMLADREAVLNDVVSLMETKERFGLNLHVSEIIYSRGYRKVTLPVHTPAN
ncbi:BRO-N domain-containing protein [Secundilactobacillus kimchicus]|uniref:Bro-N domain-containing protein n=1 Tax=Secundilactobacillus kimchicus JCM 15530 TaxID=1302272 RepID=A0A0R1HMT7_9LACO|nr:BRO family protein [Secundilactobacillus kimchicus]KRK48133.1 hypothetical protein FC96_GL001865 [Secundilactobacillus kimchicus JCM 15530]